MNEVEVTAIICAFSKLRWSRYAALQVRRSRKEKGKKNDTSEALATWRLREK